MIDIVFLQTQEGVLNYPKQMASRSPIVLGAGHFGTCLAQVLSNNSKKVLLYSRSADVAESINQTHYHPKYLKRDRLSAHIEVIVGETALSKHLLSCSMLVFAVPTEFLRDVCRMIKKFPINKNIQMVLACKGIEQNSLQLPLNILEEIFGKNLKSHYSVLSGPSFAEEIMKKLPTCMTISSFSRKTSVFVQSRFHQSYFRVYINKDPIGTSVGGALKNVIAIAAGATEGLRYGYNAKASLMTRGLAEIVRIGTAIGASFQTFMGLSGMGDLFLSCTSSKSRNFRLGFYLAEGDSLETALRRVGSTAEGFYTTQAAYKLLSKLHVSAPIVTQVYNVLNQKMSVDEAVGNLLKGIPRHEFYFRNH